MPQFYKRAYPTIGEAVIVKIDRIEGDAVIVKLLAYGEIEGVIYSHSLTHRDTKIASVVTRKNRKEVAIVTVIDKQQPFIELSRKAVEDEEREESIAEYRRMMQVYRIMKELEGKCHERIQTLYNHIVYPLQERGPILKHLKKIAYKLNSRQNMTRTLSMNDMRERKAFYQHMTTQWMKKWPQRSNQPLSKLTNHSNKSAAKKYDKIENFHEKKIEQRNDDDKENYNIQLDWPRGMFSGDHFAKPLFVRDELVDILSRRLKPKQHKVRADIHISCYEESGMEAIRHVLKCADHFGNQFQHPIDVLLVCSPHYVLVTKTNDTKMGIHILKCCIMAMRQAMKPFGGNVRIMSKFKAPRLMTKRDEHTLAVMMQHIENELKEIPADDDIQESMS